MTNSEFIRQLYLEEAGQLKKFIETLVFDKELAEDILQETFCTAIRRIDDLKRHPNPVGWLYTTAKYIVLAESRKRSKRDKDYCYEDMETQIEDPQAELVMNSTEEDMVQSVLSEKEYQIVDLVYNQGYKNWEAAEKLDIKESTLRVKLLRIRNKLSDAMKASAQKEP